MFRRKLIEVLFDAGPEADEGIAAQAQAHYIDLQGDRRLLSVPADPALAAQLARRYESAALGMVTVRSTGQGVVFDFGEWSSEVASRRNADGTWSAVTTAPGLSGFEFVLGKTQADTRALVIRDGQHEYQLVEME
jgi:hypothetical protein